MCKTMNGYKFYTSKLNVICYTDDDILIAENKGDHKTCVWI